MDERIKIDDRLASFYDKLYADDSTVEACKGRVAEALEEMADSLRKNGADAGFTGVCIKTFGRISNEHSL